MKNPSEDIPKGTIRAIVLTYITYVGLLWIIGFTSLRCSDPDMNKCPTIADQAWATSVGTDLSLLPEGGLLYNKLIVVAHSSFNTSRANVRAFFASFNKASH